MTLLANWKIVAFCKNEMGQKNSAKNFDPSYKNKIS